MGTSGYEWDPAKERSNFRKHKVHFADAVAVLEDERSLIIRDPGPSDEERMIALGMGTLGRVLVVVYVWRGETLRLISARKASRREMRQYGMSQ
jgi:hypothetical protein